MDPIGYTLVGLLVGCLLGGAIGWLLAGRRSGQSPQVVALERELRQQLDAREAELNRLRESAGESQTGLATLQAQKEHAEQRYQELKGQFETQLQTLKQSHDQSMKDLREVFKGLSMDALKQTQPEFLRLAKESLGQFQESAKGDLAKRQESIKTLVEPLKQQLEAYQKRLQQSESSQSSALGEVKKQLDLLSQQSQSLAQETQQFRMVLKSNSARGRWGEETLRRVVEAAGLSKHCDFTEQMQSGDRQPDLVVHLPGERMIIVDSKVPDLDFLQTLDQASHAERTQVLNEHVSKLKITIKELADRDYPEQFPHALDHVVLFLPAESLFSAALEADRNLIIWAASKKILLATPASFIALLRSVSVSWQQHSQTENAKAIAKAATELYGRVCKFTKHFERIRAGLERANNAYNDAVGSYERMIRPSGERLLNLGGGKADKQLESLTPVETPLRLGSVTESESEDLPELILPQENPEDTTGIEGEGEVEAEAGEEASRSSHSK